MIKVAAPNMALKIIDQAIQAFGAAGVSDDAGLARDYASMRDHAARRRSGRSAIIAPLQGSNFGSMPTLRAHIVPVLFHGETHRGRRRQERRGVFRNQAGRGAATGSMRCGLHAGWCSMSRAYQGPLTVLQFKGGQSNPTYRLDTPARSYVLRRKPFGQTAAVGARGRSRVPRHLGARQAGLSGRQGLRALHRRRRDRRGLLHHVDGGGAGVLGSDAAEPVRPQRGMRSSRTRSRRSRNSTPTIRRRSAWAISASPAIISRARSTAGPSSTARPRPSTSRRSRS